MSQITSILRSSSGSNRSGKSAATFSIADIIKQLQAAQNQANDANIQRYNEGLAELNSGRASMRQYYEKAQGLVQDIGASALQDVERGSERAFAQGRQSLISSGLSNTTLTANLARGTEEDRQRAALRVEEQVAQQQAGIAQNRAGAELGASGGIASFIANRNDVGPDIGQYAGLIRDAAAANTQPVQASLPARSGMPAINTGGGRLGAGRSASSGAAPGQSPFVRGGSGSPAGKAYVTGPGKDQKIASGQQGGVYGQQGQAVSPKARQPRGSIASGNVWSFDRRLSGTKR